MGKTHDFSEFILGSSNINPIGCLPVDNGLSDSVCFIAIGLKGRSILLNDVDLVATLHQLVPGALGVINGRAEHAATVGNLHCTRYTPTKPCLSQRAPGVHILHYTIVLETYIKDTPNIKRTRMQNTKHKKAQRA